MDATVLLPLNRRPEAGSPRLAESFPKGIFFHAFSIDTSLFKELVIVSYGLLS